MVVSSDCYYVFYALLCDNKDYDINNNIGCKEIFVTLNTFLAKLYKLPMSDIFFLSVTNTYDNVFA